jgi:glycosyltransferase involved in cell wall biosynthesis
MLYDWMTASLERAGHRVERIILPFDAASTEYLEQLVGWRAIDLRGRGDLLITMRPPSYVLRHERKACWFVHHHRAAYDLWGTRYASIPGDAAGRRLRDAIRHSDDVALRECEPLFANSPIVARRLHRYNRLDVPVLYPAVFEPERFELLGFGDYLFYPSRLTSHKRQHLAIEAMRLTSTPVKLLIGGPPEEPGYVRELEDAAVRSPARERIEVRARWLSEREKERLIGEALAIAYLAYDEDSYGFPLLEGAHAGKATVTLRDSGGAAEHVRDGVDGLVADDVRALAEAFDRLWLDRAFAQALGAAAQARIAELDISWDAIVRRLVAGDARPLSVP